MKRLLAVSTTLAAGLLLASVTTAGAADLQPVPDISAEEFKTAQFIYFDRCSGCHGALRKGATGKNIAPANTRKKTVAALEKILYEGTDGGMPGWGKDGFMTRDETNLMARFVQNEVPEPPEWNMKDMEASWKVHVPVADRPAKPPKGKNWLNYFGVVLRDAGFTISFLS